MLIRNEPKILFALGVNVVSQFKYHNALNNSENSEIFKILLYFIVVLSNIDIIVK